MHPFAMETAAILVHSLNRFSLCTKMAAVAVAKLLLCCDIICKRSIEVVRQLWKLLGEGELGKGQVLSIETCSMLGKGLLHSTPIFIRLLYRTPIHSLKVAI